MYGSILLYSLKSLRRENLSPDSIRSAILSKATDLAKIMDVFYSTGSLSSFRLIRVLYPFYYIALLT